MGLKHIVTQKREIVVSEDDDSQKFSVRGLSFADVSLVMQRHGMQSIALFGMVREELRREGNVGRLDMPELLTRVVAEMPGIVSAVLLIAADEDIDDVEAEQVVTALRVPVQVEALAEVAGLTFNSVGEVEKLLESLTGAMNAGTALLPKATTPADSVNGGGTTTAA